MISQFAFHDNVPTQYPKDAPMFVLHDKLAAGKPITTEEKKKIINSFYGVFGQRYGASYKQSGWAANFTPFLKRFLVNQKHYGWREYYSFNKTMLRDVLGSHNCIEIIELPKK